MIKGTWLKAVRRITSSSFESTRCVFLAAPRSATQCQQVNARGLAPDFQTCQVKNIYILQILQFLLNHHACFGLRHLPLLPRVI